MESPSGGERISRAQRDAEARATLTPLGENERPIPLVIGIVVALVLAVGVSVGAATVHDLSQRGGSVPGAIVLTLLLVLMAVGMYRRRYGAVLAFEGLLAFQILVTSLALIVASTILAAIVCALSIGLSGWLFWKLIRVMGRLQAGEPGRGEAFR